MSPHVLPLTRADRLGIAIAVGRVLATTFYTLITCPFRGSAGAPNAVVHVKLAAVRALLENLTVIQYQRLCVPIHVLYADLAKKKGFTAQTLALPDGTEAYWFGNKNAKKVVFWIHGGGLCLPADPAHISFAAEIAEAAGNDVAVLLLSYELAPYAQYPHQLIQGVEVMRHLVTELKYEPSNIILAGDSVGANLALGILSHISHPHPSIPPLTLSSPLRALLLLTPWTSFTIKPSGVKNKYKDVVSTKLNDKWSHALLGDSPRDRYNEPGSAEPEWWRDIPVGEILVMGSADECLTDTIREIAENLEAVHPNTTTILIPDEFHDQPLISILGRGGQQGTIVKSWIASQFL